ncbi:MAG TPA: hypothetical protein VLQ45_03115 [Thermoanaerobaculia bacterium]|nr:hypothetical protein [Thermoanaerobaculia bacterium]
MNRSIVLLASLAVACCLASGASPAGAAIQPSSDLLLPYFEVDTQGSSGRTTLFAVCNHSDKPVEVLVSVHTNWGIPVLDFSFKLDASQVRTVNLRDWLLAGELPDRKLGAEEISHLQAVLSGRASPRDQRYFSTEVEPGLAVGSITFRVRGVRRPEVLWGDFFLVDPAEDHLQAEALMSLGRSPAPECIRHGVRFLAGGDFEAGTELVIWSSRRAQPSSSPEFPDTSRLTADAEVYNEAGRVIGYRRLSLLPVQKIDVAAMDLSEPFGWLDVVTEAASIVTARYGMGGRSGVSVQSFCLPTESLRIGPALRIEQLVNGEEAAVPPGTLVAVGSPLQWGYTVTNAGSVPLDSIFVTNNLGLSVECPESSLDPGRTMTCTASGIAEVCVHEVTATVNGMSPFGSPVLAQDTSYYSGDEGAAIDFELLVQDQDADEPPGPSVVFSILPIPYLPASTMYWHSRVANTGPVPLLDVSVVTEPDLKLLCPKANLEPGEFMDCQGASTVVPGPNAIAGMAAGTTSCGVTVSDRDPAHYVGEPMSLGLSLEILINGVSASVPPGPQLQAGPLTLSFVVVNTGNARLNEISIAQLAPFITAINCPRLSLDRGEAMVCAGEGYAIPGPQQLSARVSGVYFRKPIPPPFVIGTSATAVSYYVGIWTHP